MKIMQKKGEAEQILEIWFQIWNLRKKLEKKHLFPQCIIFIFYLNRKAALCPGSEEEEAKVLLHLRDFTKHSHC